MTLSDRKLKILFVTLIGLGLTLLVLALFLRLTPGTPGSVAELVGIEPSVPSEVTADRLGGDELEDGAVVSVGGTVLEQDGRRIVLHDVEGPIHVETPESLPLLTGQRLLVTGSVTRDGDMRLVRATEWLYDSSAVVVRSE